MRGPAIIPAGIRRIAVIRTDRLGEVVLNLPAIAALRRGLPQASVTMIVHPLLRDLLTGSPIADQWIVWAPAGHAPWWARAVALAATLRQGRYDAVVIANARKEFHLAAWLAGVPVRIGYARKWGGLLTHRVPDRKADGVRHEVECNFDLVKALGVETGRVEWPLPDYRTEAARVQTLLAANGAAQPGAILAVHPWSSNPNKIWPADRYRALISQLAGERGLTVVLCGGPEHVVQVGAWGDLGGRAVNLVGQLTVRELAALLQRARLLLSNDSGPVHVAAALGIRCVVLFGSTTPAAGPARWGPWGQGHVIIHRATLADISVEDVVEAVRRAWG